MRPDVLLVRRCQWVQTVCALYIWVKKKSKFSFNNTLDPDQNRRSFLHEYSPTMNNYINKLSCWYVEQKNTRQVARLHPL